MAKQRDLNIQAVTKRELSLATRIVKSKKTYNKKDKSWKILQQES